MRQGFLYVAVPRGRRGVFEQLQLRDLPLSQATGKGTIDLFFCCHFHLGALLSLCLFVAFFFFLVKLLCCDFVFLNTCPDGGLKKRGI